MFTTELTQLLSQAFAACGYDTKYGLVVTSGRPDLCQFQCNGAMGAAKEYRKAPFVIADEVVAKLTEVFQKDYDVIDIDGARIVFEDGWGLVRASNTQPALVLRFEALSETRMAEIRELVESTLETVKKEM